MKGDGTTPGWDTIQTDADGCFTYQYKLDGIEGLYEVRVYNSPWSGQLSETPLTTAAFTDKIKYSLEGYTLKPQEKWTDGILKGWLECSKVPYRLEMKNVEAKTYNFANYHDNELNGVLGIDYCTDFYVGYENGASAPSTEVTFSVSGPYYYQGSQIKEIYYTWTVTFTSQANGKTYYAYWKAHLAIGSNKWPGAKLHARTDATGSQDVPIEVPPSPTTADLIIQKIGPNYAHVNDIITYTYMVINEGPANATNVVVEDDKAGIATYVSGDTNNNNILEVGETWIFTASYTVLSTDPDPLTNTVTVTTKTTDPNSTNNQDSWTVDILHPSIMVTKIADATEAHVGDVIEYKINVTNVGDCPLYNVNVADTLLGTIWTGPLNVGESRIFTLTYTVKPGDQTSLVNGVIASGKDTLGQAVTDSDSWTVNILYPDIRVEKFGPSYAHEDDTITYTITVSNPSTDTTMYKVSVIDLLLGDISAYFSDTLAPQTSETKTFTYTVPKPQNLDLTNTVTVTYKDSTGKILTATASWTVDILHPAIDVIKSANATIIHAGDWVKYNITVVNIGDCDLTVTLSDPLLSISWTGTLKPGEKHEEIASIKPTSDPTVNTASATGTDALGKTVTDFARCTVDIIKPAIDVAKTGPQTAYEGDTITYTITVTNTGDCALSDVSVVDSALGFKWTGGLAIGETKTFSIQYTIPEGSNEIVNTVFASGKDALGKMVTDYATWTVEVIIPPAQITEVECCCSVTDGNFKQIKVFTAVFTPTNSRRTEYKLTATKPNAFYYVIKITNTGTSDATPVVINFQLDQDFIIKGIDPIQVHTGYGRTGTRITASTTYNTNSGTITISNLNAGQTLYITISMDYKYKGQTFSKSEVYNWVKTHPSNTFNCTLTQPNTRTCSTTIIDPPTLNSPEKIPAIIILAILSLGTSLTLKIKQRKPKLQK
ncbi:MAG: hypothetical protein QW175_06770 [Candidatus Bathyarchaeia archaeon]